MISRFRLLPLMFFSVSIVLFFAPFSFAQSEKAQDENAEVASEADQEETESSAEQDEDEQAENAEKQEGAEKKAGRKKPDKKIADEATSDEKPDEKKTDEKKTDEKKTDEKKTDEKKTPAAKAKKYTLALSQDMADQFKWRSIGPANMSGRITAIAVNGKDTSNWWAATASGGLLKTSNNGVTLEHQFDDQATVSIGDVQVSQSNPDIVWVGTGESNPRNSVSWGDGVYKSTDAGKTWTNMGLKKSFQTGALAIHPTNPDVVWVGALGRLWGPNPERGLYKTSDGGKTWKQVLFVNDVTGVIDVQVNPKKPDELLVATYERKRDGFDGNDPVQRFGAGSGIYKSTDGGESFSRVSEGLPTCKLGRIGLDYFESDPNVVVAIVESEKIAQEPENYSFAGMTGSDATDVGAKVVRVTKDGPSDKAGLKVDDVVVSVDGRVVPSYSEMLLEMHKKLAGETVKLVVSRERKLVDIEIELGKKPKPRSGSRTSRTDFTGTLGGQPPNLQDTQGPDGHEYGGIYLSEDGGSSWKRINTLNPRPMYYSNIQIDPVDRNNMYVCGTSLYKSSDGGETFTGDGGSDGIHVDHHALWLNSNDPRQMILGNDGGIHITYDRMEHWDHLNHVAIGQFYHVGVDSNLDYNVYGGLQDNGSWGGPSRGKTGSGPVNTDWFRVGGGDGFVTLVDPEDPNQIYWESQNGGMGRIHLETGERGFIRPSERGKRFRFNWKTPFMLSPHNSRIHYSAGNHVFRSLNKGDNTKRISPEITNTSKGAGSAITESPTEEGVLYVGTTDGAVWMTKDGGINWQPLFYNPEAKKEKSDDQAEEESESESGSDQPSGDDSGEASEAGEKDAPTKSDEESGSDEPAAEGDPVSGQWEGRMISDRIPEDRAAFGFTLKLKDGSITGEIDGRRGPSEISEGKYDAQTGAISFSVGGDRGSREYSGTLKDGKMEGTMSAGGGRMELEFEATKKKKDPKSAAANRSASLGAMLNRGIYSAIFSTDAPRSNFIDDPVSGEWKCVIENENLPGGRLEFSINLKMDDKQEITGQITSAMGDSEITQATFNAETKRILISAESEQFELEFQATLEGNTIRGSMDANAGQMEAEFEGQRDAAATEEVEKKADAVAETIKKTQEPEKEPAKDSTQEEKAVADDGISGTWTGQLTSQRGDQDFTLKLNRKTDSEITGTFESTQGERDINSGSFNRESKQLTLNAETDQFTMELVGSVADDVYSGELNFNAGTFTMEFSVKRSSKEKSAEKAGQSSEESKDVVTAKAPTGENTLSGLMPGPRWVSSLEASRFKKERCYISFDGHRSDDDGVYVFVTNDYGKTWGSLKNNLPDSAGSVRVIREDRVNENLLYLGCEFSSWYSIDGGKTWTQIKGEMPTVAVHEFAVHPTAGEVVAATHGRSLWIADVSVLRQLTTATLSENAHLYETKDAIRWRSQPSRGDSGTRKFVGTNPNSGTTVAYSLGRNARRISLEILDLDGDVVKEFEAPTTKGLHLLDWNLRPESQGGRGRGRGSIATGEYLIRLKVDGKLHQSKLSVKPDPGLSNAAAAELEKQLLINEFESEWFSNEDDD